MSMVSCFLFLWPRTTHFLQGKTDTAFTLAWMIRLCQDKPTLPFMTFNATFIYRVIKVPLTLNWKSNANPKNMAFHLEKISTSICIGVLYLHFVNVFLYENKLHHMGCVISHFALCSWYLNIKVCHTTCHTFSLLVKLLDTDTFAAKFNLTSTTKTQVKSTPSND